jgi:glycosyltransferase involved in cell wall biosynthesis
MRIWILDPSANTPHYDLDLTAALRAAGVNVRLMTSRFLHEDRLPRAEYAEHFFFRALEPWAHSLRHRAKLRRAARLAVYPFDQFQLWREFRRNPPDVLHVQWTLLPVLDTLLLRRMARRVPLVLTVHNPLPRQAALSRLTDTRPLIDLAAHVIVHAAQNKQALLERVAIDSAKVSVVPLGPSLESQDVPSQSEARATLNIPDNALVVLFFGIIKAYKGLMDLIEAMPLVRQRFPNSYLLVAGRSEDPPSPYIDALNAHQLDTAAKFALKFIPSEVVSAYFAASDVVCLPYREASQSAVLLTAYRFARPVVVTNVGGLPETVEDGQNGFVVPPQNPPALAEAIGKLLADPALRERFGARSHELAQTRFGWDRAAALTLDIYKQVIADYAAKQ